MNSGASFLITKPFSPEVIQEALYSHSGQVLTMSEPTPYRSVKAFYAN